MKISRRILSLMPFVAVARTRQNDNDVFPWADARCPDTSGNCFHQVFGRCVVKIDGMDISNRCFMYDCRSGVAACYLHRDGKPYVENGTVIVEVLRGKVEVFLKKP